MRQISLTIIISMTVIFLNGCSTKYPPLQNKIPSDPTPQAQIEISEQEIRQRYDTFISHLANDENSKQYKIRQIVTLTQEEAISALARIKNGTSFLTISEEVSIIHSKNSDGSTNKLLIPKNMPPYYAKILKSLKVGDVSDQPIKVLAGWQIIQVISIDPPQYPPYESLKTKIKQEIIMEKAKPLINNK